MTILFVSLWVLSGCDTMKAWVPKKTPEPKRVYLSSAKRDYTLSRVAIFRFVIPDLLPEQHYIEVSDPGYAAAQRLHQKLLQKKVFREIIPVYAHGQCTFDAQRKIAKRAGCDLVIAGNIFYYFEGGGLSDSRIDQGVTVIDVPSWTPVWAAESTEIGKAGQVQDYFVCMKDSVPAPTASSLLVAHAERFSQLLAEFSHP